MTSKPAILILSDSALPVATRIKATTGGEIHGLRRRVDGLDVGFEETGTHLRALFVEGRPIVAVMAAGAVIRLLAPLLSDKRAEPPVIAVAEDGSVAVPLLGGHHGANDLARRLLTCWQVWQRLPRPVTCVSVSRSMRRPRAFVSATRTPPRR